MTIKTKIVGSAVAALLMSTTAFAGTLQYSKTNDGLTTTTSATNVLIAKELTNYAAAYPTLAVSPFNLGEYEAALTYSDGATNATFMSYVATLDGSGTVSDAALKLKFNGTVNQGAATDVYVVTDPTDGNKVIAREISRATDTSGNTTITFDSDSQYTFTNAKTYYVFVDPTASALGDAVTPVASATNATNQNALGNETKLNALGATLEVWSTSGTEVLRDTSDMNLFKVLPQYEVACDNKLNNLINVENSSLSFVSTKHGALLAPAGGSGDVMDVLNDSLRFTVTKTAVDYGLDGDSSKLIITPSNDLDALVTPTSLFSDQATASAITYVALVNDIEVQDAAGVNAWSGAAAANPIGLNASKTTYTVNMAVSGAAIIPATTFTANYVVEDTVFGPTYEFTPAAATYKANTSIGSWEDFAYIGQIAGATQSATTKTKLFIVNRSCKAVTPEITLVKDGVITVVAGNEIAVDSQGKVDLGTILAANGLADGQYALEIKIPGNAEDFYVYAQAFNAGDGITKDLPVYNTSRRD